MKIASFVYFCITHGKLIPTLRKRNNFPCVIQTCTKFENVAGLYFPHSTTFSETKLSNFTNFRMLFNAVVMNFPISTFFKILSIMQTVHRLGNINFENQFSFYHLQFCKKKDYHVSMVTTFLYSTELNIISVTIIQ